MNRYDALGAALITFLVGFLVLMGVVAYSVSTPEPIDEESLCPIERVVPHTVMLVDRTDVFTKEHIELFHKAVVRARASLTVHERFSIFLIENRVPGIPDPILSLCRPASGNDAHWLYENGRLVQNYFDEHFGGPLAGIVQTLKEPAEADTSPIMETIRQVAELPEFALSVGRRRLIIISDFLQNVDVYSHYRSLPSYEQFRALRYAGTVETDLRGVEIELVYLSNLKVVRLQTQEHRSFWMRYFSQARAASLRLIR